MGGGVAGAGGHCWSLHPHLLPVSRCDCSGGASCVWPPPPPPCSPAHPAAASGRAVCSLRLSHTPGCDRRLCPSVRSWLRPLSVLRGAGAPPARRVGAPSWVFPAHTAGPLCPRCHTPGLAGHHSETGLCTEAGNPHSAGQTHVRAGPRPRPLSRVHLRCPRERVAPARRGGPWGFGRRTVCSPAPGPAPLPPSLPPSSLGWTARPAGVSGASSKAGRPAPLRCPSRASGNVGLRPVPAAPSGRLGCAVSVCPEC